jgi:Kdo2-lipid IVA lauroyltransferase/acyltransferase
LFKNKIEYYAFVLLAGLFRIIGVAGSGKLAGLLGRLFFYIVPIRKKTVFENLRIAFPQKSEKEIIILAKKVYQNFSLTFAELLLMHFVSEEELLEILDFSESDELLKKYFSKDYPFFLLSGHFGNWELSAILPKIYGRKIYAMAKPMRNPFVSDWVNKSRERFGIKVVLLGPSIREIYKLLKENGIVLTIADQRGPSDGVRVNWFNTPTAVFNGTAVLALKTSASILMIFFARQNNMNYKVVVKELVYSDITGNDEEKIQIICQRYFSFLEEMIKEYPDQWFWMHKIWKY